MLTNAVLFHRVRLVWDATAIPWSVTHAANHRVKNRNEWSTEVFAPLSIKQITASKRMCWLLFQTGLTYPKHQKPFSVGTGLFILVRNRKVGLLAVPKAQGPYHKTQLRSGF